MRTGVVYGLVCPIVKRVRYIGSTLLSPEERLTCHKNTICTGKHGVWIQEIKDKNLLDKILIDIIEGSLAKIFIFKIKKK